MEMALACDIILASEKARMGLPEVGLGIHPGFGGTQRLPRLVGRWKAKELILTAGQLSAREAKEIGMVKEVYPADRLREEAEQTRNSPEEEVGEEALHPGLLLRPGHVTGRAVIALTCGVIGLGLCLQPDHVTGLIAFARTRPGSGDRRRHREQREHQGQGR